MDEFIRNLFGFAEGAPWWLVYGILLCPFIIILSYKSYWTILDIRTRQFIILYCLVLKYYLQKNDEECLSSFYKKTAFYIESFALAAWDKASPYDKNCEYKSQLKAWQYIQYACAFLNRNRTDFANSDVDYSMLNELNDVVDRLKWATSDSSSILRSKRKTLKEYGIKEYMLYE